MLRAAAGAPTRRMLNVIFSFKFVHVLAAAAMLGVWSCLAIFMLLAHRSNNPSVVALTSRFVVRVELMVVVAAMALQPLSGIPLAYAIGLSPFGEFWLLVSLVFYLAMLACWLAALRTEMRIRDLTRDFALNGVPLDARYRALFRRWSMLAAPLIVAMIAVFALMVWQPQLD